MKAAVIDKPGNITLRNVPLPKAGPEEIIFEVQGCGLCASSIPVFEGRDWFTYPAKPGNPGHESWGKIVEVGANVKSFKIGDRIAALSYHGFATFDKAHQDLAIKLPAEINHLHFPGEPLGCAMNIFRRSGIKEGQTVAIIGIGFLGALLIQLAKSEGAHVIAISKRAYSLEIAKGCAADETILLDNHWKIIEKVREITNDTFCDRVIECTGKEWPLNLAGELTRERGRLTIAGFHQDGMRQVNVQLWNWRGLDVINAHERDPRMYIKGMREAVDAVMSGRINPGSLYTHQYKLDELNEAFTNLITRPDGFMKGIFVSSS
ncbi:MAG: zinc-binding dehydrogenase [Bacteroidetes bacterium]|nr:zinc-binding dehydrogenase [Bacteroidota bacterium]